MLAHICSHYDATPLKRQLGAQQEGDLEAAAATVILISLMRMA